ncbi:chain length determinant protein EpsF [Nitrosomonas sp. sh817]|uniref:chain length determinant protein EpsF n=1 Tax=Nitrosomonas sp. sh817 TaxID=3070658 RepID=UPI0027DC7424|nr:chain length determinant protein EpsF [Nitrosomonas sp. sh817]WMJ09593.1 chain length determinant protein EpsF [Nitrosomonas sp. sh817]
MDFSRFFFIVLARYKLILLTLVVTISTTLIVSLSLPKSYKSSATLLLTYKGIDPVSGSVIAAHLSPGFMATQIDVIKSSRTALMVIDQLRLDQSDVVKKQHEDSNSELSLRDWLANFLLRNVDVETSRDSSVIGIGYKGPDPMFAAAMANAFANAYQEISIRLTVEPSQKAATYFTDQLNVLRERLETAQRKLTEYQQEKGIIDVDYRLDAETKRLDELSRQLIFAQADLMGTVPEGENNSAGESTSIARNAMINNLRLSLVQAETKFSEISQRIGSNHPTYGASKADVDKLRAELNRYIRTTKNTAINQESEIRAALEEQKTKVLTLNRSRNELLLLAREVEGAQQAYNTAMQRLNQTSLEGQANLSTVSILDAAKVPDRPDSPKIILNTVLSVILGTLLGLGIGLLAEMIDRRVRSAEDLIDILQVPVLGVIKRGIPKPKRLQIGWPRLLRKGTA